MDAYINLLKKRRSIYALGNDLPIDEETLEALVKDAVRESPSPFNSQSSRVIILFDDAHKKLWDIVENTLKAIVPENAFPNTQQRLAGFAAGKGTILFFEDTDIIESLQNQLPDFADNFPIWSEHSSGIAQHSVWVALANNEVGASLQHYNPLIDEEVAKTWDIPSSWKLRAQMPFGNILQPAGDKEYMENEERFRVIR